ncbi:MAG: Gfo/Idh/MocA family oxidoreductase [Pirellulales bacterium]|nr:Gfo/Idh/MocA family oxidoreductase [Pirellulales bacterium]
MSADSSPAHGPRAARRDFLKTAGLAAGAAVVGPLSIARGAYAAGSDVLKVGLIGCGGRGSGAAGNALSADPGARLVAMGDLFEGHLKGSLENLKKARGEQVAVDDAHQFVGFDAYQKVIDSVDVVVLGEPPHFRPQHLQAAIEAGKHVFCEKPVAVDAPGVRSVLASVELAQQKNLNLVSGLCWRYDHGVKETMRRVLDGAIGEIRAIQETYLTQQTGRAVPREPGMSEMEYQIRNWYFFRWLCGDFNVEQHVHSLDKALWAMGDKPPLAAWGIAGRQLPKPTGDIYDHYAVVYEYPDGVQVHAYCRQQSNCFNDVTDRFVGTKGTCDVLKNRIRGANPWRYRGPGGNMYLLEHVALFEAIRNGKTINNGQYMAYSTMMGILGRMVGTTGKRITWEEALASQETLGPKEYRLDAEPPILPDAQGNYPLLAPGVTPFA